MPTYDVVTAALLTVFAAASIGAGASPSATVMGTLTLTAADGTTFFGEGVRVTLACAADATTRTEVSDERGAFRFVNVPAGRCSIEAEVQGFSAPSVSVVTVADQAVVTDLHLEVTPLRSGVIVNGTAPFQTERLCRSCRSDGHRRLGQLARCIHRVRPRRVRHP
jgi:hypothetical protein